MTERVENRGLEESPGLEGNRDEISNYVLLNCGWRESKIKYTRALLLELTELEVCRKLPCDFDLLILRQLDGGSDRMIELEHNSIIGKPFDRRLLPTTTRKLAFPGERWDNHLYTPSKKSHLQINCGLDIKDTCQLLTQKLGTDAGVVHCEIQKCSQYQLTKIENPCHPPHLSMKLPPLETFYEPGVKSSGESEHKGSADDTTGHDKSGYDFALADANDLIKEKEANEVNESSEPLDECEEFWRENEENEVIALNKSLEGLLEDHQPTFDDIWAEILEIIHLQQEPNTSPMNGHSDAEAEIQFPDEPSAVMLETTHLQEELNTTPMISHSNPEVEIHFPSEESLTSVDPLLNLPDEESLISIYDMIGPDMTMKLDDQTSPNFSGLGTRGKLQYHLPHNLLYDQAGFLPLFLAPDILPFCPETSLPHPKTKSSVSHYSLLHQPNIFPQLPHHLLPGTTCPNTKKQMAVYDVDAMQSCTRLHK